MIQLYLNNQELDIYDNQSVNYTIQVNDLADVSSVNSSVTSSFSLPKTKNNINYLNSLSIIGDNSNKPYVKNNSRLSYDYIELISKGWLKINNSDSDNYNVNIENGIIDFFKAIEGKSIGKDLDLSSTNHNKDLVSVIDSFQRNDYCYIVADYNGLNTFNKSGANWINTDYLIPSLNNKYIWNKIFSTFGFTYTGSVFNTEEFTNLWITYPKAPPVKAEGETTLPDPITRFTANRNTLQNPTADENNFIVRFPLENRTLNGVLFSDNKVTIQTNGTYKVSGSINGFARYQLVDNWNNRIGFYDSAFRLRVIVNGTLQTIVDSIALRSGDIIEFVGEWSYPPLSAGNIEGLVETEEPFKLNSYNITLQQTSQAIIDFGSQLLDISISDYIKEIMIRFSLTPIINVETRNIHFITLNERLNPSTVVDWSDKYIKRTNETYTYNDYAIRNYFKHKYNDQDANFNDGFFTINNQNLNESKDIFSSKFYSYNKEVTRFANNEVFTNNVFPLWDREIKETINNDTNVSSYEVNYKGLENRYYFIRKKNNSGTFNFGSQVLNVTSTKSNIAIVDSKNLSYAEVMSKYANFSKILNNTRIHEIDLLLTINELNNINLNALYYFQQESQYYILNRLNVDLKTGRTQGEFIRVIR